MEEKWRFIHEYVIIPDSINAAFQRASIYDKQADDYARETLRGFVSGKLSGLQKEYSFGNMSDDDHCNNISGLAESINNEYAEILIRKKFRIGVAQKLLNIYLKYLWCMNIISNPPHCPFDSGIVSLLEGDARNYLWTKSDSIVEYRNVVYAAREKAKFSNQSLAEWELTEYQKSKLTFPA